MKRISILLLALTAAVTLFVTSCSKEKPEEPSAESSQVSEESSTQSEDASESIDDVSLDEYISLPYIPFD